MTAVSTAGQPLPAPATFVAATDVSGSANAAATVSSGGTYSLTLPADGTYRLVANAPGFAATVTPSVTVDGASAQNVTLTSSGAKLSLVPVYGGGSSVAADGTPGVFYIAAGNVGDLYRTADYGGTWTQVTVSSDDPSNGLSESSSPALLATSGFPGEVAVLDGVPGSAQPGGVFYSTDYGVSWHLVGNSPTNGMHGQGAQMFWGHAGQSSVLVYVQQPNSGPGTSEPYAMYVADMTVPNPSFVQMSAPYARAGQPIAVADGAGQPWIATVDSTGKLSVSQLTAQSAAPTAAFTTLPGFPTNPVEVGLGGQSAAGTPPSGVIAQSDDGTVGMALKAPGDLAYTTVDTLAGGAPRVGQPPSCGAPSAFSGYSAHVSANTAGAPSTTGTYGAAWIDGCWVQDAAITPRGGGTPADTVMAAPGSGSGVAIDPGYNTTNNTVDTSACQTPGVCDAVVMRAGISSRGIIKSAATSAPMSPSSQDGGVPVMPSDQTVNATRGTGLTSGGAAVNGVTAATVYQTTFGPDSTNDSASATALGGVASDNGGASFDQALYGPSSSVAWWQGASDSWLLYGLSPASGGPALLLTGFENWSSTSASVNGGNIPGSTAAALGVGGANSPAIGSVVGVPSQDTAFVDAASGSPESPNRTGALTRIALAAPGPSISNLTSIGAGTIVAPGPLAYCPSLGPSGSLRHDVLFALAVGGDSGALYRVDGATGASPTVSKAVGLLGSPGMGLPSLAVDCASGTVLVASGSAADGLLESTDGGATFTTAATYSGIRTIAIGPGDPFSILVGLSTGVIEGSSNGGLTWTGQPGEPAAPNDPGNGGFNFNAGANASGGLWDLTAPPTGTVTTSLSGFAAAFHARAASVVPGADLVAGPGELAGNLAVTTTTPRPLNTGLPSIAGGAVQGQRLQANNGRWQNRPSSFSYQWQDCDRFGNRCKSIAGALASTRVLSKADVAHTLRVIVSAYNAGGRGTATSTRTALVTAWPTISRVSLAPSRFQATKGTLLRLTLSAPATVTALVTVPVSAHKVKGKCKANAKQGKRCTLALQKAKLSFRGAPGKNSFKLRAPRLAPGRCTLTLTARSAGSATSKPVSITFTIVKPKTKRR